MSERAKRRAVVVAATPTPNGDLHIGHMAGPYLAGDVYSRYLAADGRDVIYTTVTDDSQTYVTTTAHRLGVPPGELCATATEQIGRTISAMGLSMRGLPPVDERYRAAVREFFTRLHAADRLRPRTVRLPYAEESGRYLYDGLMTGACPECLAASSGGVCEGAGTPTTPVSCSPPLGAGARLAGHHTGGDDPGAPHGGVPRAADRLLRRAAAALAPARRAAGPRAAGPTAAGDPGDGAGEWGVEAPFPETPGQILYPWVEAMPAVMYATWWSAAQEGRLPRRRTRCGGRRPAPSWSTSTASTTSTTGACWTSSC
ncbi:class I tRNA ligase family protein [Streptomyces sp. AD16]|nr:class I tRNA ligase family protein [Streptomyces sp. AD16]